jgi:hypothetical protein
MVVDEASRDREDQFLDDISNDELSDDAPQNETKEAKTTQCTCNAKRAA